ncbi:MAG TPA: hypothetical protein VJV04_05815 [Nitrospiraceae bacterium]|nr:hypothetical protein [Nitrospiraceae bacterium]
MTPFWIGLLKRAMPVVIEAGSHLYKRRAAANQASQPQSAPVDSPSEKLEAMQRAIIRIAEEVESVSLKQNQVAEGVTSLRRAVIAALLLATVAIVMVLLRYR